MRQTYCGGITPFDGKFLPKKEGVDEIVRMAHEKAGVIDLVRPVIIGIAGGSGSGKSTLAKELAGKLVDAKVVNADDYYKSCKDHDCTFDEPEALDLNLLAEHINVIKGGGAVQKPIYDFRSNGGERVGYEKISPAPYMVIEGLFVLNDQLAPQCDIKVFIETDEHGRIVRRITRDPNRTGQDPADILAYFLAVIEPTQRRYIDCQKNVADIIIRNPYDRSSEPEKAGCVDDCQVKVELKKPLSGEALRTAGAKVLARTSQVDTYFKISDGHEDELIRVREEPGNRISFTYKTPIAEIGRSKFEFLISPEGRDAVEEAFAEITTIHKIRDLFILNGIVFSLDEVKFPGERRRYFIELREPKSAKNTVAFLGLLGIDDPVLIKASYLDIAIVS